MPIHLNDLDVISEVNGMSSALIVPCNLCPAVTVAARENKPFIQLFKNFLKSAPFEQYIKALQAQLKANGVNSRVFESNLLHQWFMCMWTSKKRKKLLEEMKHYEAVIVIGCDSATETVADLAKLTGSKVIEAMGVASIMNAKLTFQLPCNFSFKDCKTVPISQDRKDSAT